MKIHLICQERLKELMSIVEVTEDENKGKINRVVTELTMHIVLDS